MHNRNWFYFLVCFWSFKCALKLYTWSDLAWHFSNHRPKMVMCLVSKSMPYSLKNFLKIIPKSWMFINTQFLYLVSKNNQKAKTPVLSASMVFACLFTFVFALFFEPNFVVWNPLPKRQPEATIYMALGRGITKLTKVMSRLQLSQQRKTLNNIA